MRKAFLLLSIITFLFFLSGNFKRIFAQGSVNCYYSDTLLLCVRDLLNPGSCDSGYETKGCTDDECCIQQNGFIPPTCDNVTCEPIGGPTTQCSDGADNDGDGEIDFPNDPGCFSVTDDDETNPQCDDGIDNDSDGFCDLAGRTCTDGSTPGDPGCNSSTDNDESGGFNVCTAYGNTCRPDDGDPNTPVCLWNEVSVPILSCDTADEVCCQEVPPSGIADCPPYAGGSGQCRTICDPKETEYSGINQCQATGQKCCLYGLVPHPATCSGGFGINTAFGCIRFSTVTEIAKAFLSTGLSIAGGIAFLIMIWAGLILITSSGNPEKTKHGQELLTAAIAGLTMIILSVIFLEFVGVDILGLGLS